MKKFKEDDIIYFIESSSHIRQITVLKNTAGFCSIRFESGNCGPSGIRVRESKLFKTKKEAEDFLGKEHRKKTRFLVFS